MKKQQIKIIIIIILVIIILALASILLVNKSLTGFIINEQNDTYMYTKAICNETNFCQDTEITCQGNKLISVKPIEGAVIQHSEDWQDPRAKDEVDKLC